MPHIEQLVDGKWTEVLGTRHKTLQRCKGFDEATKCWSAGLRGECAVRAVPDELGPTCGCKNGIHSTPYLNEIKSRLPRC